MKKQVQYYKDKTQKIYQVAVNSDLYYNAIKNQGLFPVLVILRTKEVLEKYEDCQVILDALLKFSNENKKLGEIPTHLDQLNTPKFSFVLSGTSLEEKLQSKQTITKIKLIKDQIKNGLSS